jgi:HD-like signal output (HDOD) protein
MKLINKIIKEIDEFPTLPTIYSTLSEVISNPRSTAGDVSNIILQDQSSASKILKTANSAAYGVMGKVTTVSQAVVYIGFEEVKNLIVSQSILDIFGNVNLTKAINPIDLWKHSIAVGIISKNIAKGMGIRNFETYFLSGILHDIGKLLFLKSIPELYDKVINYSIANNIPVIEVEKNIIGMSSSLAGSLLAEKWNIPATIRNTIKYQHIGLLNDKPETLVSIVHLANIVAEMLELGYSGEYLIPEVNKQIWQVIKLPTAFFTKNLPLIIKEYQDSVNLLLKT